MPGGNLRAIRKRIGSVKSTQQITRAMKMVSGAKLRRAEERVAAFNPFAAQLQAALAAVVHHGDGLRHPLLAAGVAGAPPLFVLVTSDRGLCGAFNANVVKQVAFFAEDNGLDLRHTVFHTVGRKAREQAQRRKWTLQSSLTGMAEPPPPRFVAAMAERLAAAFVAGAVAGVTAVYNRYVNALTQRVTFQRLLPLDLPAPATASRLPPLSEPDAQSLVDKLAPRLLETQIEHVLLHSLAGEHGARMAAMDAATKNASEMISGLTLQYNRARQAAITSELLDIINGKNAIE